MKRFFRKIWWHLWEHRYAEQVTADLLIAVDNDKNFYGHSFDLSRLESDGFILMTAFCPKEEIDAKEYGIECRRRQEFVIYRKGGIVIWLY